MTAALWGTRSRSERALATCLAPAPQPAPQPVDALAAPVSETVSMPIAPGPHLDRLMEAIASEAKGHQALLAGDSVAAERHMREASRMYRSSWELATPESYGRLVGMLKAAVIAGDARTQAAYVREQIRDPGESAAAHYALAVAALVLGDDVAALAGAEGMGSGSPAFGRAAKAIKAIARHDRDGYAEASRSIVRDFEGRERHLTGVAIADTAVMLDRLAQLRGIAFAHASPVMPRAHAVQ